MLTRSDARSILHTLRIPVDVDFHTLRSDAVESLVDEARKMKYRAPVNRNGSTARYFHAYLVRRATSKTA